MSFVSYAQNFEDVMLWRALGHVANGFYVDVGANDPDRDSVTRAFYERGWCGINIEPVPEWHERLRRARPRDINLRLALGVGAGEITLYEVAGTGLSTVHKVFAEQHVRERGYEIRELRVEVDTLAAVCARHRTGPIHFLKIDVEGAEKSVIEGADFDLVRPWIVLVESTLPNTQKELHAEWEPLLLGGGYEFVYFDGLNRYYVAREHPELKPAFRSPPNVFDEFVRWEQQEADLRARQAEERASRSRARMAEADERAAQVAAWARQSDARARQAAERLRQSEALAREAMHRAVQAEERLQAVYASNSWRVTRPLRWLSRLLQREPNGDGGELKRLAAAVLRRSIRYARSSPRVRRGAAWLARRHPLLAQRLRRLAMPRRASDPMFDAVPDDLEDLPPRVREIHFRLQTAIERVEARN